MYADCSSETCSFCCAILGPPDQLAMLFGYSTTAWSCPTCEAPVTLGAAPQRTPQHFLEAEEAFGALQGLGLRSERSCHHAIVQRLLTTQRIKQVRLRGTPNRRTVIERIDLEDGTILYLGAAPEGAVVFRVVEPSTLQEDNTP